MGHKTQTHIYSITNLPRTHTGLGKVVYVDNSESAAVVVITGITMKKIVQKCTTKNYIKYKITCEPQHHSAEMYAFAVITFTHLYTYDLNL